MELRLVKSCLKPETRVRYIEILRLLKKMPAKEIAYRKGVSVDVVYFARKVLKVGR